LSRGGFYMVQVAALPGQSGAGGLPHILF
jgi:hypothetical protein